KFGFTPPLLPKGYFHVIAYSHNATVSKSRSQSVAFDIATIGGEVVNVFVAKRNSKKKRTGSGKLMMTAAGWIAAIASFIAIRYATARRQGTTGPNRLEKQVIIYPSLHIRLLPILARADVFIVLRRVLPSSFGERDCLLSPFFREAKLLLKPIPLDDYGNKVKVATTFIIAVALSFGSMSVSSLSEDSAGMVDKSFELRSFRSLDVHNRATIYDQVEQLIMHNAKILSPLEMVMHFYKDKFDDCIIPVASTTTMQRVASLSERGGLWLVDTARDVVTVAVIAQISDSPGDLKCGEYLDMNVYNREVFIPAEISAKQSTIYEEHLSRFDSLLNFLQQSTIQYLDSVKVIDDKLYPDRDVGMTTFVELHDHGYYGLRGKTMNIFHNVPTRKTRPSSAMLNIRGQLPDPRQLRKSKKERNLQALVPTHGIDGIQHVFESLVCHWPDSEGCIRSLAEKHDLSGVRIHIPEVYDSQGVLVHPMDYEKILVCGRVVEIELNFHLWDITKSASGNSVNKPNRICSNIIRKLRVLPGDEDDMRLLFHTEALNNIDEFERRSEELRVAEEAREIARREEVLRLEQTMAKAKATADAKKKRLQELRVQTVNSSTSSIPSKRNDNNSFAISETSKRIRLDENENEIVYEEGEIMIE
ncbi:hypothetical protein F5051DRAFT_479165, partial [Lentinula edodes]